jgi:cell division inhibitor SepF
MASMWRRAMVYLGLQDDDELEYGGEYESYGEYADAAEEPQNPRARRDPGHDEADGRGVPPRDSGTVRTRPETRTDYGADYGAPEPAPARPAPVPPREEPSGMSAPRPSVVRTIGPTTAARVHVVEPQGFNDAQEVGDRLKANQPVILNLQGLPRELQRRLIDFSSGLAYAVAGSMQRVADQVFLLTPSNVEVSQEEKDRLQARGLFQP